MKKCTGPCGETKELSEFHKVSKKCNKYRSTCKVCTNAKNAKYASEHRDEAKVYRKHYYKNNRLKLLEKNKKYREVNKNDIKKRDNKKHRTLKGKYYHLKGTANSTNREMTITFEQYEQILIKKECYYCDESLEGTTGSSLNRIDNSKGYTVENVLPCCSICNNIMMHYTKEQIISRIYKLAKRMD